MKIQPLKIGTKTAKVPIIQGGMGVGISLGNLAGAVAKEGGIGIISAAQPGFREADFIKDPLKANLRAIKSEYEKARKIAPDGIIGFNLMVAMEHYEEYVHAVVEAGADLIHIETMSDSYEVKAAVLAAKENTSLPVFATMVFDETGKLLTGGDVPAVVTMLEGLRVDALGINCGMGPEQMLPILEDILKYASVPIIVKPNAGLPKQRDGEVYYDVEPEQFARYMAKIVEMGAHVIGGCCGTTPAHIQKMVETTREMSVKPATKKDITMVSSYGHAVILGGKPMIIGERINPTGKKKFKQALKDHDMDYILKEGITQQDKGAHILDVNVGLPDIDEPAMMKEVIMELQSVSSLPLQIDTVDITAMEAAMRIYNGKPMVNSVNGKQENMDAVFPLIKRYGGVVIGLTIDEDGIPATADGRVRVAGSSKKRKNMALTKGTL